MHLCTKQPNSTSHAYKGNSKVPFSELQTTYTIQDYYILKYGKIINNHAMNNNSNFTQEEMKK
jgi:hypothetical protein